MIHQHDRSGWFGASDTSRVVGNWDTETFQLWWLEKLGVRKNNYRSVSMAAGSAYEHRILDAIGVAKRDRQIRFRPLRLRVNLDGESRDLITEVKTYAKGDFKVSAAYWQQCQVEMLAARKACRICAYRLNEADYENFFNPVELERVSYHPIEFDFDWVTGEYLPRLVYLAHCLRRKECPTWERYLNFSGKASTVFWLRLLRWLTAYRMARIMK